MVGEGHSAARAGEIKGQTGAVGNREQAALDVEGQISRRRTGGSVESIASADTDHIILFAAEQRFDRGLRSTAVARAREHRIAQYSRQVLLPVLERAVKAAPAAVFLRIRLGGGEKRRAAGGGRYTGIYLICLSYPRGSHARRAGEEVARCGD